MSLAFTLNFYYYPLLPFSLSFRILPLFILIYSSSYYYYYSIALITRGADYNFSIWCLPGIKPEYFQRWVIFLLSVFFFYNRKWLFHKILILKECFVFLLWKWRDLRPIQADFYLSCRQISILSLRLLVKLSACTFYGVFRCVSVYLYAYINACFKHT